MKATITGQGQITIPLPIRRKLKLPAGTNWESDEKADGLKAVKCVDPQRMRTAIGIARSELSGKSAVEWLEELRGPVELPAAKTRQRQQFTFRQTAAP